MKDENYLCPFCGSTDEEEHIEEEEDENFNDDDHDIILLGVKTMNQTIFKVKYQIATYSGVIEVSANEDEDNDSIISKAKQVLKRKIGTDFPFGYQSFKVI
jgi:hypothetical protein